MLKRVAQALSRAPDGAVVITHAGAIRAARMICEDWTFQDAFAAPVPYAEPIEIRI